MKMLKERIRKMLEYLKRQIYPAAIEVQQYKMIQTEERFQDIEYLDTSDWKPFDREQFWGGHRKYYWFETSVTIPEEFDGKCLTFEVRTGREGEWDATNPQFSIYVDGVMIQGLDVNHREIILTEEAQAGRRYRIILSAFTGDQNFRLQLDSRLKILDREVEHYYYDLAVPYQTALLLNEEDQAYIRIIHAVNESLNLLDFRKEVWPWGRGWWSNKRNAGKSETNVKRNSRTAKNKAIHSIRIFQKAGRTGKWEEISAILGGRIVPGISPGYVYHHGKK